MNYSIFDLMQLVAAEKALAIHLCDGRPPLIEQRDCLDEIRGPDLEPDEALELLRAIAPPEELTALTRQRIALFWHRFSELLVFRVLAFEEHDHVRLELRIVTKYQDAA